MKYDYAAKMVLDSYHHTRLTTLELTYPRFIHAELMTHRMFSRNSASSRAIPIRRMIEQVESSPAYPRWWGRNQSGMQAYEELCGEELFLAKSAWNRARINAIAEAENLLEVNAHKQLANRILEPFSWITVIVTATDWDNFFTQRLHTDAQPEIRYLAELMRQTIDQSDPQYIDIGNWHTPYIQPSEHHELDLETRKKVSVARCARVSYLTHDGVRDLSKDLELYERLIMGGANGHWSPFEHVARPSDHEKFCESCGGQEYHGNFRLWIQLRKEFSQENTQVPVNSLLGA